CPDPDNDNDRILDEVDECRDPCQDGRTNNCGPETYNGFEDEDGCPDEGLIVVTCERIEFDDRVYFETDSDVIQERSFDLLRQLASTINGRDDLTLIRIEGHTDDRGSDSYNLDLSQRRAASVVSWLVDYGGVDRRRLISAGFGETVPIDSNRTSAGRANNRRVEFHIVEQSGCHDEAPGGM
ncbi:MAG: OmpA family protein, partial [Myxococcales bacterium]|nr:OmpA family protein [Myxococcales bacterium]